MLITPTESIKQKLSSIPVPLLREFARQNSIDTRGSSPQIILRLVNIPIGAVDEFIKAKYAEKLQHRQERISDDLIKREVSKVRDYRWGVVQGQLDALIQKDYVRKFAKYDDLVSNVVGSLHQEITQYVIASWFNHWTTVLIEDHISTHRNIVPTIKHSKGVDVFIGEQPLDIKITYLPRNYSPEDASTNPRELVRWLYEKQGPQRFGADNRFFIVLFDPRNPENSWKLKRNFEHLFSAIDAFLNDVSVSNTDEVLFTFGGRAYTAHAKILLISQ